MSATGGWQELVERLRPGDRKAEQRLRDVLQAKPGLLLTFASVYLAAPPDTAGKKALASLLTEDPVLDLTYAHPEVISFSTAHRLLQALKEYVAEVDLLLARRLTTRLRHPVTGQDRDTLLRGLSLLTEIGDPSRLLSMQIQFMRSGDPFIRSKGAALIGKVLENRSWFDQVMEDADPRTRANAVEALWRSSWPPAEELFVRALDDPHHRVVANAIIGLYLCGRGEEARRHLEKMAADLRPEFQAAAAFATRYMDEHDPVEVEAQDEAPVS
jgi:HEAT repeat protein